MVKSKKKIIKKLKKSGEAEANKDIANVLVKTHEGVAGDLIPSGELFVEDKRRSKPAAVELQKTLTISKRGILQRRSYPGTLAFVPEKDDPCAAKFVNKIVKAKKRGVGNKIAASNGETDEVLYDLWDQPAKVLPETKDIKEDYKDDIVFRHQAITRSRAVNIPHTMKEVISVLPAVQVLSSGASYRPEEEKHKNYLASIIEKEEEFIKLKDKVTKRLRLAEGGSYATPADDFRQRSSGLFDGPEIKEEVELFSGTEPEAEPTPLSKYVKLKTRKRIAKQKKLEEATANLKLRKKRENQILVAPTIVKRLKKEEKLVAAQSKKRVQREVMRRVTRPFNREDGKYKEEYEPFLLSTEVPESLRTLKPQGSVLESRVKSLEKRNIIVGSQAAKKKIPMRLKFKFVEKRDHKSVGKGYKPV
uniref:Ribosome biogenesis protein NOP53 n=1 Tax=Rhabditophanes sp. KR3021 TaxID=114890 RepID=A0AC35U1X0_9BILA